ncbi:MAG: HAD family hydrolase [Candidatus Diapherotrites archaeon]
MFKAVFFDFGDTLADISGASKKALKERPEKQVLTKQGFKFSNKEFDLALKKMKEKTNLIPYSIKQNDWLIYSRTLLQELGIKRPSKKLTIECENAYYSRLSKQVKLMPGTLSILEFLKKKRFILCVISNTRTDSSLKMAKRLKVRKYFAHFIMSHEFGSPKSEVEIFHEMLRRINRGKKEKILPRECLMVGDNLIEDGAAKKLGMKVAILKPTVKREEELDKIRPEYVLNSLKDLEKIVR